MYPRRRMLRQALRRGLPVTVGIVLLALLLALAVVGCSGGGGQPQQQEEAKASAVPEYGDLRPGKYVTDEFKPAFSFEVVDEGWVVGGAEERGILDMKQGAEGPVLSFVNEQEVFDPSKPRDMVSVPSPKNLVTWLQRHPYLQTEQPQSVSIGGGKGVQLDAVVADVPATECGDTCLGLFMVTLEIPWVVYEKERVRFTVLENVGGERVTIAVGAPAVEDFEEFLPKAQKVIDTVKWEGA